MDPHALLSHCWNDTPISRRTSNGYVNTTAARLLPGNPVADCPASSPLADWRQSSWPLRGTDRPPVVAGDNRGAMTLEATRKLSHPSVRAIASTDFL